MTPKQATLLLNLSYRNTKQLFKNYSQKGRNSLKLKNPKISNSLKFKTTLKKKIVNARYLLNSSNFLKYSQK